MTTTTREVCFLIGKGEALLWADVAGTACALPDSRRRWEKIWELRGEIEEIAHSHPHGPAAFSHEDETTMEALTSALGRELRFSVVAPASVVVRVGARIRDQDPEPWWADLMRLASGMNPTEEG